MAVLHRFCCILDLFLVFSLLYLYRLEEMLHVCRDLLQQDPTLVDVWMIVANLYAANNEVKATQQVGISIFQSICCQNGCVIDKTFKLVTLMLSGLETLKRMYMYV